MANIIEEPTSISTELDPDVFLEEPPMFRVLLHNDDYTPMDFVVMILCKIFHKNQNDAETIMLAIHQKGIGLAGVYPHDIAETKVHSTLSQARENGHPLRCTMEPEED